MLSVKNAQSATKGRKINTQQIFFNRNISFVSSKIMNIQIHCNHIHDLIVDIKDLLFLPTMNGIHNEIIAFSC